MGLEFTRATQETKSASYKLTQLARKLTSQGHGILLLVDELQANSSEVRRLAAVYQEMVGERLDVALVLAGLPGAVSATLNDRVLTFLNRARKVSLPPLPLSDVDAFFLRAFEQLGMEVVPSMRAEAVRATAGSPYLLQLVGHNMAIRARDDGTLEERTFEEAVAASREDFERAVCATTLAALSGQDVAFLRAMTQDDRSSGVGEVAERMGVTYDYAQKYRRRLIDAGVIEPAGRGRVAFCVPLLAEHLRREG